MNIPQKLIVIVAVLAMLVTACGGTEVVGKDIGKAGGGSRLDEAFNKEGEGKKGEPEPQETKKTDTNSRTNQQEEEEEEQVSVRLVVSLEGYNPSFIQVFVGGIVFVENKDTQPRSVTANNGAFDSGPIKPGGTWKYTATTPGTFEFTDSTRPYVVGKLEVIAQ